MKNLEFETKFFIINLRMEDKNNIERFNASVEDGLSDVKVLERKDQKLTNKRIKAYGKSLSQILLSNIFSVLNITLLIVMGVMLFFQLYFGLSFAVLLLINIGIGLYGDIKARVTLKNDYIQSNCQLLAIRNGERVAINQENIVLFGPPICWKVTLDFWNEHFFEIGEVILHVKIEIIHHFEPF